MKRFTIAGILILLISLTAIAETNDKNYVSTPSWSEFCPYTYLNARIFSEAEIENLAKNSGAEQTDVFYCKYHGTTAKIIRGITIIPALDCWAAKKLATSNWRKQYNNANIENTYWYERKLSFESELEGCKNLSKEAKAMCYMKVRELELQKNAYRQQDKYNQALLRQQAIQNSINNFNQVQMNNNLQNINNNLRNINNKLMY